MVEAGLEDMFPGLRGQLDHLRSPRDHSYNCIAFAAGDNHTWWWPDLAEEDTWPVGVARVETVEAFGDAFATLGYMVCDHDQLEPAVWTNRKRPGSMPTY
jgi:hypothetical protein